jgi:hypothetical protein
MKGRYSTMCQYQRSEKPGIGNTINEEVENDTATTAAIGRMMNSRNSAM